MPSLPVDSAIELLGPVGEADDAGAEVGDRELVAAGIAGHRRRQHQTGVVGGVGGERGHHLLGLVEQLGDVDAGQPGRHQPEGGQRAVAAADVRVGEEDLAVALLDAPASPGRSRGR